MEESFSSAMVLTSYIRVGTNGKMNKKLTVLDYVLKCAYEKGEEELLLGLVDQLKVVDDCMNMSSQEIVQDMESLQCTLHFLEQELLYSRRKITLHPYVQNSQSQVIQVLRSRYTVQLENYVKEFRVRMPSLLQAKVLLQKKLVDLADFFAYDSSNSDAFNHNSCTVTEKIDTIQIFQSLQELRNEINKSKEKVEWQVYHEKSKTIGR